MEYLNTFNIKNDINDIDWKYISEHVVLSESFIREFKNKVNWYRILSKQQLSENFIKEFQDMFNWCLISIYQKLSEDFIREFHDKVNWYYISKFQILSEDFIREFKNRVNWDRISKYQILSENFILEFKNNLNRHFISEYQKLSPELRKELNIFIPENNWLYKDKEYKMNQIKNCGLYEIDGDYVIAYKSTRLNGVSIFNNQYKYQVGKTYNSHCDCNVNHEVSFGLSAWAKEKALNYNPDGELYKVKIYINDIGALVQDDNKLRCFKLDVVEKINI